MNRRKTPLGCALQKGIGAVMAVLLLAGCESTYYNTMEKFGIEKREILVDRVEETRDAQEDAKEQFRDALEQYRSVINFEGGELEKVYNSLRQEYEESEAVAGRIAEHIRGVEDVSEALFDEWEEELEQIGNATLRSDSAAKLRETQRRSQQLIQAMWRAEQSVHPVLDRLRDQVLYLKHNLNARAIAALKGELRTIDADVERLILQMQASIDEANEFIRTVQ